MLNCKQNSPGSHFEMWTFCKACHNRTQSLLFDQKLLVIINNAEARTTSTVYFCCYWLQDKMDIRCLALWAVVQCLFAAVNVTNIRGCPPLNILNGYFVSDQNSLYKDTQLYYACDEGFMPVEGSWWGTLTCQNGQWSSKPGCIENTACFDPKIDNGIYEKATVYLNNTTLRIKCKPGYADKKSHAVAQCENGQWKKLPVCDKQDTSCGPPPRIPNSVIINKEYSDIFPVETEVFYKCQTGFELHMDTNNSVCSHGQWYPRPSCREKQTHQDRTESGGKAAPIPSGSKDIHLQLFTRINRCGHIPQINFGSLTIDEGQMFVSYQCDQWFKLKGNSIVRCFNGQWTQPPTCEVDYCKLDTSKHEHLTNMGNVYIKSGTKMKLHCPGIFRNAYAKCLENQLHLSDCCLGLTHSMNMCDYSPIQ
ncbi:complement factor H-related protein 4-like [Periophthalmus magnuspinnatus]|uniref:complement factor H-related protein 4-like n=1 Tax=Periophthalmus magnuspinnatus TaxID=409849 RepID=UPI002436B5D8|nr:complement factor H-related protein 4-like [Periophthalmus magnuspinnatus]